MATCISSPLARGTKVRVLVRLSFYPTLPCTVFAISSKAPYHVVWNATLPGMTFAAPAMAYGVLLVPSWDGRVHAFGKAS